MRCDWAGIRSNPIATWPGRPGSHTDGPQSQTQKRKNKQKKKKQKTNNNKQKTSKFAEKKPVEENPPGEASSRFRPPAETNDEVTDDRPLRGDEVGRLLSLVRQQLQPRLLEVGFNPAGVWEIALATPEEELELAIEELRVSPQDVAVAAAALCQRLAVTLDLLRAFKAEAASDALPDGVDDELLQKLVRQPVQRLDGWSRAAVRDVVLQPREEVEDGEPDPVTESAAQEVLGSWLKEQLSSLGYEKVLAGSLASNSARAAAPAVAALASAPALSKLALVLAGAS